MVEALEERLRSNPKGLVGNRGYARYLKVSKGAITIDLEKVKEGRAWGQVLNCELFNDCLQTCIS